MKLSKIIIVPSKSRLDIEIEKNGCYENTINRFRSERIRKDIIEGHYAQKENLSRIVNAFGNEHIIDRSLLTKDIIMDNEIFIFLGGDNHFSYCSQEIARYMQEYPQYKKFVLGAALDPRKSFGAMLYFSVDKILDCIRQIDQRDFLVKNWTLLESIIENENGVIKPYPAISEYLIGEEKRLHMSRNIVCLNGKEIFPEKSSGIIVAVGAGSGIGSWYHNAYPLFREEDIFTNEERYAKILLTEHYSKSIARLNENDVLTIDSNNDSSGIVGPDGHEDHAAPFGFGARAEIRISKIHLPVIKDIGGGKNG